METNYQLGSFLGTGWGYPFTFSTGGADVYMVSDVQDIFESLEILLGTSIGERVMEENFGCNLMDYLFEELDERLTENLRSCIQDAIRKYETRIELEDVTFDIQVDTMQSCIYIRLIFRVRHTNSRYNLVYPFYLSETIFGKNLPMPVDFVAAPQLNPPVV
jgi:uncharacterized protein